MYTGSTPATAASSQNVTLPFIAELYNPNFLDILLPSKIGEDVKVAAVEVETSKNPMMDALRSTTNQTFTDNGAPAYSSTESATLDAFQGLNKYTFGRDVNDYLDKSWNEDSQLTLRMIWNLRSIHDGKGEKEAFYRAFGWLYDNHPRTAIHNLYLLVAPVCTRPKVGVGAAHGYWKDLLNIVTLASLDQLGTMSEPASYLHSPREKYQHNHWRTRSRKGGKDARIVAAQEKVVIDKALAKHRRAVAAAEAHERLLRKLKQPRFLALYIAVARLFSERLAKDMAVLKEIEFLPAGSNPVPLYKQISLAAKWAPTPHNSHDRHTNLATAIASLLHQAQATVPLSVPVHSDIPYSNLESLVLRSFYQRWILTQIRKASLIPEPLMSANRWKEIRYTRVSSVCMNNNMDNFYAHDPEGFEAYLTAVEGGEKKISGATLMPHELVRQAIALGERCVDDKSNRRAKKHTAADLKRKTQMRVVEAQWRTMIERLRESGSLDNSMAICDVSGSMGSLFYTTKGWVQPIYPAISLSLVLAQLAKPPFNNAFITFSSKPSFHQLDPSQGLVKTIHDMASAHWEMNTDLNAVFLKLLLPLAVEHQVKQEDMIKRLFVFSDMQFDDGAGSSANPAHWETSHDAIEKAYTTAGYEVPEIVYWNLMDRANATTPVTGERKGVALMSGFSPAMLKVFMGEIDPEDADEWEDVKDDAKPMEMEKSAKEKAVFDPISAMKKALLRKSYEELVVVD